MGKIRIENFLCHLLIKVETSLPLPPVWIGKLASMKQGWCALQVKLDIRTICLIYNQKQKLLRHPHKFRPDPE
jgi:hypothetical protein